MEENNASHTPDNLHESTRHESQAEPLEVNDTTAHDDQDARSIHRYLYTSHFLSTWNSRSFEFGAYIFLASIYPQTLLPASIYSLTRAACAAFLSPWLGRYVDSGERLQVVRVSIVGQRIAVAASCATLLFMIRFPHMVVQRWQSTSFLVLLCLLAVIEKLSSVLNTIAIERDWVVVVAQGQEHQLRLLNSQMRRIDLFCKLMGPLAISLIDTASTEIAIMVTGGMTCLSVIIEYLAIAKVYRSVPALQVATESATSDGDAPSRTTRSVMQNAFFGTATYVQHPAFLPSFALALLYLTVLSFAGQMITYLLALGVSSGVIGLLRGVAALFELSATWLGPIMIERIGPIRSGIWFINWQIICVSIACIFFWLDDNATAAAIGTVCAVIASRVGLWGFDLSVQTIVQEEVQADLRGTFSSQEFAFQNIFEMLSFASTVVFARPDQFKVPATISAAAVGLAGTLYAAFVRSRRGHLVHLSKCIDRHHKSKHGWSRVPHDEEDGHELSCVQVAS